MRVATFLALALVSLVADVAHAAPPPPAPAEALPFIEDDYGRALELAKKTRRPLFVDSWAPW